MVRRDDEGLLSMYRGFPRDVVYVLFCCIGFFCFGGVLVHDRIVPVRKGGAVPEE